MQAVLGGFSIHLLLLANVYCANITRVKKAQKGRALRSLFDGGTAVGFFSLHDADDGGNNHSSLTGGFDGVDGGGAGSADVVYDDHAGALFAIALDAAAGTVLLLGFANQKAVQ